MKRKRDKVVQPKEKKPLLQDSFLDRTLLRLRWQYGERELVKLIEKENSNLRVENGKLQSYALELEEKLKVFEEFSESDVALYKAEKKLDDEYNTMKKDLEKARRDKNDWERQYFKLLVDSQKK